MPYTPDRPDDVWDDFKTQLSGTTPELTNFTETSFNYVWGHDAVGGQLSLYSQTLLHIWASSKIDYAGKALTDEDLRDLNIDPAQVDLTFVNALQSDADLENLAALNSVTRDPGVRATGEVLFTLVSPGGTIDAGVTVSTRPDSQGTRLDYVTTDAVTAADDSTTVLAPIEATQVGPEYNVGAGAVNYLPSDLGAVAAQSVTNPDPILNGESPEGNDSLRQRARGAMARQSGGGTEFGIIGGLISRFDGVSDGDVVLEEYPDPTVAGSEYTYSHAIAVVDAPNQTSTEIQDALDDLRSFPLGIYYRAPTIYTLDVSAQVSPEESAQTQATAADIDEQRAIDALVEYLSSLGLGDDLYEGEVEYAIRNSDRDIAYLPTVTLSLTNTETSTTETVTDRRAITAREKIEPGTISISAVENP